MNIQNEFAKINVIKDGDDVPNSPATKSGSVLFILVFLIIACVFAIYCIRKDSEVKKR